jgi:hypothetical protein
MKKKRGKHRGRSAAFMRSINPFLKSHSTKRGHAKMRNRHKKSYSRKGINPMKLIVGAVIYGAVREKASNALTPLTSKIPLGNIADEAVLGTAGFIAAKKGKGIIKDIGTAALLIESARVGEAIATNSLGLGGSTASSGDAF